MKLLVERFGQKCGHLVWYERDKTRHVVWHQHVSGELPRGGAPLQSPCTLRDWLAWHEAESRHPEESIEHLFYLIDVEVPDEELDELRKEIPLVRVQPAHP